MRGGVAPQRILERVEAGDRRGGDGHRHAHLVGEPGRDVGARLADHRREVGIDHEHDAPGHAFVAELSNVAHSGRS